MTVIWICPCGCGQKIYRDGPRLWIESNEIYPAEQITYIDNLLGFVNGKYSVMPDGLLLVQQELEFPQA